MLKLKKWFAIKRKIENRALKKEKAYFDKRLKSRDAIIRYLEKEVDSKSVLYHRKKQELIKKLNKDKIVEVSSVQKEFDQYKQEMEKELARVKLDAKKYIEAEWDKIQAAYEDIDRQKKFLNDFHNRAMYIVDLVKDKGSKVASTVSRHDEVLKNLINTLASAINVVKEMEYVSDGINKAMTRISKESLDFERKSHKQLAQNMDMINKAVLDEVGRNN